MNASEDVAGVACRRGSTRLRTQAHASEEGAVVAGRCSALLHPQVHASEEGAGVLRCGSFRAALASPLEDGDLLREILLRVPPQPSSLLRASAVCKQWRSAATDPKFLHRFRIHHRKPPVLGVFHECSQDDIVFTPILDRPDRIPPQRFDVQLHDPHSRTVLMVLLLDCRHGLVLLADELRDVVIVCNPISREQRRVTIPFAFTKWEIRNRLNGAMISTVSGHDHVLGSCNLSPLKVVLIATPFEEDNGTIACVYSSETGEWGDIISAAVPCELFDAGLNITGMLVGNALYWLLDYTSDDVLEFDLEEQSLGVIRGPPVTCDFRYGNRCMIQAEEGILGFAVLSYPHLQVWQRNINFDGAATWALWKTFDMHTILGLPPQIKGEDTSVKRIVGCVEDADGILLSVGRSIYMVQLKSMQSRKICENSHYTYYHSFKSFYPPGTTIAGGCEGAEMFYDT